jgi:hypothetical protein
LEEVIAGAEKHDVVALVAVDEIVCVAGNQNVGAIAAQDRVVARASINGETDQRGEVAGGADRVVAAIGEELEGLGGADVEDERPRTDAVEADAGAVGLDGEDLVAIAALDLGDVCCAGPPFHQVGPVAGIP